MSDATLQIIERGISFSGPMVCGIREGRWRSGRFMPRWASRLTLENQFIGAERLQEITEEDAKAEGAPCMKGNYFDPITKNFIAVTVPSYRFGFRLAWDSLYAKSGHGWDANDWLWVIGFAKCDGGKA
jgi:hypothetical protein